MMVEEINKRLATSESSAIVTLEPSDFPRLCRVPHMLKDWRIQLPRSSIGPGSERLLLSTSFETVSRAGVLRLSY